VESLYYVYITGRAKDSQDESQQAVIAEKKAQIVSFFEKTGMKTAAANFVGRSLHTIRDWEASDEEFRADMLRAKANFAQRNQRKVRLDNLSANLYPDDYKPPKQEVNATVITIEGQSADDLLAEAKRLGPDTTPYESLLTRPGTPGAAN
jgi:hypothetical protein